jgi:RNA polymerase sigma-70 factor (ECF subfamily)
MHAVREYRHIVAGMVLRLPTSVRRQLTVEAAQPSYPALIVAVAQRRDRGAFSLLFAHFAPRVKSYLRQSGLSMTLAEELAQETLLTVWSKAGQYDPARANASAWIFTIARNLRTDTLRRARLALPEPDPTDEPPPPPIADAVFAAEQDARRVRAALEALPAAQLEAVQLAFVEDQTHSEIEASLGVPLGTVKSRLRLALSRLRTMLKDEA